MQNSYPGWDVHFGSKVANFSARDLVKIQELETLYDRLKSVEARRIYLKYGHEDFLRCSWCEEPGDHLLYSLSSVLFSYGIAFLWLGLGTVSKRKQHWRVYGTIGLTIIAIGDAYSTIIRGQLASDLDDSMLYTHDLTSKYRAWAFAAIATAVALLDRKAAYSVSDHLQDIISKQQVMYNRTQAFRLARTASLSNSQLRRKLFDYFGHHEALHEAVHKDTEYQQTRERALLKFNVDNIVEEAQTLCDSIVQAAVDEGIVAAHDYDQS
ncbi:hypothetical protein DFS34DRAFT_653671 [Phlyctochytrium arcticum]|nr:hypothetical protein DFS34DRAFT_653671 [Phlyctochytrium arcticum]